MSINLKVPYVLNEAPYMYATQHKLMVSSIFYLTWDEQFFCCWNFETTAPGNWLSLLGTLITYMMVNNCSAVIIQSCCYRYLRFLENISYFIFHPSSHFIPHFYFVKSHGGQHSKRTQSAGVKVRSHILWSFQHLGIYHTCHKQTQS